VVILAELIESLVRKEPKIGRVYLFGSRRYGGSLRSDIGLLVETSEPVTPAVLGQKAWSTDPYLDVFHLSHGSATSTANLTHISAASRQQLLDDLRAAIVWESGQWVGSADGGRLEVAGRLQSRIYSCHATRSRSHRHRLPRNHRGGQGIQRGHWCHGLG
jgi:hypothetical protein